MIGNKTQVPLSNPNKATQQDQTSIEKPVSASRLQISDERMKDVSLSQPVQKSVVLLPQHPRVILSDSRLRLKEEKTPENAQERRLDLAQRAISNVKNAWRTLKAWWSSLFAVSTHTAATKAPEEQIRDNQDNWLNSQLTALESRHSKNVDENSVAYLSPKAREISAHPRFANIAKLLRGLGTITDPRQAVNLIQESRVKLLELISDEGDKWNAELRQELWRVLFIGSARSTGGQGSAGVLSSRVENVLENAINSLGFPEDAKNYTAIVLDALRGLKSRLALAPVERKLEFARQNAPQSEETQTFVNGESFSDAVKSFQRIIYFPQENEFVYNFTARGLAQTLENVPSSLDAYKQLVSNGGNPMWCTEKGQAKLVSMLNHLERNPRRKRRNHRKNRALLANA